ncbi:hypothetical protein ABG768_005103 [Culter alburnus]|uniref:Uncharacterized protein n=1 Tax=Culter alburnus TaxID=194366 RepID=A0AAW1ZTT4_CULAL
MKLDADRAGPRNYLACRSLVRYRNEPDKSLHQLRTAMHHHPQNRERAINLSILSVSGPVSALQPYSPRNPKTLGFPARCSEGHGNNAAGSRVGIVYGRNYDGI